MRPQCLRLAHDDGCCSSQRDQHEGIGKANAAARLRRRFTASRRSSSARHRTADLSRRGCMAGEL